MIFWKGWQAVSWLRELISQIVSVPDTSYSCNIHEQLSLWLASALSTEFDTVSKYFYGHRRKNLTLNDIHTINLLHFPHNITWIKKTKLNKMTCLAVVLHVFFFFFQRRILITWISTVFENPYIWMHFGMSNFMGSKF